MYSARTRRLAVVYPGVRRHSHNGLLCHAGQGNWSGATVGRHAANRPGAAAGGWNAEGRQSRGHRASGKSWRRARHGQGRRRLGFG